MQALDLSSGQLGYNQGPRLQSPRFTLRALGYNHLDLQ
jgi:hypothetical protein